MGIFDTRSTSQHSLSLNVNVELDGRTEISVRLGVEQDAHRDEERPPSPERESNSIKRAEVHHCVTSVHKKGTFCFAMVLAVVVSIAVLGSSMALLSLRKSKSFEGSVAGIENGTYEAHDSKVDTGKTLSVKLKGRDGTDPQSSGGGLLEELYVSFAIIVGMIVLAFTGSILLVCYQCVIRGRTLRHEIGFAPRPNDEEYRMGLVQTSPTTARATNGCAGRED